MNGGKKWSHSTRTTWVQKIYFLEEKLTDLYSGLGKKSTLNQVSESNSYIIYCIHILMFFITCFKLLTIVLTLRFVKNSLPCQSFALNGFIQQQTKEMSSEE